jgi:hypothetical protein
MYRGVAVGRRCTQEIIRSTEWLLAEMLKANSRIEYGVR